MNIVILRSKSTRKSLDKEDEHSPRRFRIILKIWTFLMQKLKTGITESQEAIENFINQPKSATTNEKTATDMNTLLCYMKANDMKNKKIESLPASELDHLLWIFFIKHAGKTATVSRSQSSIQRYLSEKKYHIQLTYSMTMSSKSPCSEAKVT